MSQPHESLMELVCSYCERRNWIPVGQREFSIGDWRLIVNGSGVTWKGVLPWHVLADHQVHMATVMFSAFGGTAVGYHEAETDLRAALLDALVPGRDAAGAQDETDAFRARGCR